MLTTATFKFKKGTPESVISSALNAGALIDELVFANRATLELEASHVLLDLKEKLGDRQFFKLVKSRQPLAAKEIVQKLGMAELVQRLDKKGLLSPAKFDALLQLGSDAACALKNASDALVARILDSAIGCVGATASTLKALARRERIGCEPLPSPEEIARYQPSTLVEIVKGGQFCGWVAEVTAAPDALGRLQVRLLKTCRKRTLFLHEVKLHDAAQTPEPETAVTEAHWRAIATAYVFETGDKYEPLTASDIASLKQTAQQIARSEADIDDTRLVIRWKHAIEAIARYGLVAALANIAAAPAPTADANNIALLAALAAARKLKATLAEEFEQCVTEETRDLLRQKQRHVEREIDKLLERLCSGTGDAPVEEWAGNLEAIAEKEREIAALQEQLEAQRAAVQQLEERLAASDRENLSLRQECAKLSASNEPAPEADAASAEKELKLEKAQKRIKQLESLVQEYSTRLSQLDKNIVGGEEIKNLEEYIFANLGKQVARSLNLWDALRHAPTGAARAIRQLAELFKQEIDAHAEPFSDDSQFWREEGTGQLSWIK